MKNIITILIVAYLAICYGEILYKNVNPNPQYSNWNIITNIIYKLEK